MSKTTVEGEIQQTRRQANSIPSGTWFTGTIRVKEGLFLMTFTGIVCIYSTLTETCGHWTWTCYDDIIVEHYQEVDANICIHRVQR